MKYAIILMVGLVACTVPPAENTSSPEDLKKEVMAIHDEVMPKMGDLRKTEKALRDAAGEVEDMVQSLALSEAADAIGDANENMMVWMRNYDANYDGTDQEVTEYLRNQKAQIEKVRTDMNDTLAKGKELVDQ